MNSEYPTLANPVSICHWIATQTTAKSLCHWRSTWTKFPPMDIQICQWTANLPMLCHLNHSCVTSTTGMPLNYSFISWWGWSAASLYRGKRPISPIKRWSCNWVASQWLKWHRSGSSGIALANWQSIDIFGYPLGEIWFKWIFSGTVTLQWSEWQSSGRLTLDWLVLDIRNSSQDPANRSLPSIEGSDRLAPSRDKLYYRDRVPWIRNNGVALEMVWVALKWHIGIQLAEW